MSSSAAPAIHPWASASHRPHQLPAIGWSIVREVGPRMQSQRVGDPHQAGSGPYFGRQHAGIGLVSLARLEQPLGRHAELSASGMI
jgi:hypothetical protein